MMWAPRFSANSMMAWFIWLSAMKLPGREREESLEVNRSREGETDVELSYGTSTALKTDNMSENVHVQFLSLGWCDYYSIPSY